MSPYLTFKIISVAFLLVVLIVVIISRKSDKEAVNEGVNDDNGEKQPVLANDSRFAGTNTHHCLGFDLPTAQEAFEHFRGQLTVLKDYGDMCNGHCLHTWDDGKRLLCQCSACGGLVLVQQSECHIFDYDDYYTDYFPVDSPEEAEQLNEKYGGFAIEMEWDGKKVFYTNGNVTGKW